MHFLTCLGTILLQIKGSVEWARYSSLIVEAACDIAVLENVHNFTVLDPDTPPDPAMPTWPRDLVMALTCPLGCGDRGQCADAGCQCEAGYSGDNCQDVVEGIC